MHFWSGSSSPSGHHEGGKIAYRIWCFIQITNYEEARDPGSGLRPWGHLTLKESALSAHAVMDGSKANDQA